MNSTLITANVVGRAAICISISEQSIYACPTVTYSDNRRQRTEAVVSMSANDDQLSISEAAIPSYDARIQRVDHEKRDSRIYATTI